MPKVSPQKMPAKAPSRSRGASNAKTARRPKAAGREPLARKIEAYFRDLDAGRALYRKAGKAFDEIRGEMKAGEIVKTRLGAVTLCDQFAGRDSVVKEKVYFERYSLQIVGRT